MSGEFPNANTLWSTVLVETLVRLGVTEAVTCPGSRSSPLTFALARHEGIEAFPILDERSAGFFALGRARRLRKPVVLVCTSGSAVANFFPAIVEASESGVPLIVLTADRPPELRDCAAGQTIDQVKFFGGYVRKQMELPLPEAKLPLLRMARQAMVRMFEASVGADAGPVHVNVPFRDPLIPVESEGFVSPLSLEEFEDFFAEVGLAEVSRNGAWELPEEWSRAERGLILIGPNAPVDSEGWTKDVKRLAKSLGWPVLADGLNPLRFRSRGFTSLVSGYEFTLRSEKLRSVLRPERVLVVGSYPTCKVMREWLAELDLPTLVLSERAVDLDATHSKTRHVRVGIGDVLVGKVDGKSGGYLSKWRKAEKQVRDLLDGEMSAEKRMFEGKLAWSLGELLPDGATLCVSNSMPPRDLEFYLKPSQRKVEVFCSRGANGIDGILSTALGVAHEEGPTYLLIGDLALLHDTNGALLRKLFKGSLTILLVNNAGGGIFGNLPVAQFSDVFEKHFATDQEVDFANWAKTYGIAHERVASWETLGKRMAKPAVGIQILEIVTDRTEDAKRRKGWFGEIVAALG